MLALHECRVRVGTFEANYTLQVPRGAFLSVTGPSGGGKSTLLGAIAGFEKPYAGTMEFDGVDLLPLKPAQRPVAMIFQDHNLLPTLTATQNAGLGLSPSLKLGAAEHKAIAEMLDRVGLSGLGDRLPSELSGGQRQRVALARALLTTRPLLLLDEPLSGLDAPIRRDMALLVDRLRRERGLTVLMVSHTPEDIADLVDGVVRIEAGRVLPGEPIRPPRPSAVPS
jgi:thiamine transport system ATP-binding protein